MKSRCKPSPDTAEIEEMAQLLELLNEALRLADEIALAPEVGARLQEVIDLAERVRPKY